jgi:uncharacterized protein YodC (DUF2158 family)
MHQFSAGDKVILKSGGPRMTVVDVLRKGQPDSESWLREGWRVGDLLCTWRDEKSGEEKTQVFWPEWLAATE